MKPFALVLHSFGLFATQPPRSSAYSTALLRRAGIRTMHVDIGVAVWNKLLSQKYLASRELQHVVHDPIHGQVQAKDWNRLRDNTLSSIDSAKLVFRSRDIFYDTEKLRHAFDTISNALQLVYLSTGVLFGLKKASWPRMRSGVNSARTINQIAINRDINPLREIFEDVLHEELGDLRPTFVGIDMDFPWEIVQTATLAASLKERYPEAHINFAGHGFDEVCFARLAGKIARNPDMMFGFDSIFLTRNDDGLVRIASLTNHDVDDLQTIPSLAYRKGNTRDSGVGVNGPFVEVPMDFTVIPDYSDIPLDKYFAPEVVFIDRLSNKCFWSKCSYCGINKYKPERNETNIEHFMTRVQHYRDVYGCRHLFLLDEAAPPALADIVASRLRETNADIIWSLRTRIDPAFDATLLERLRNAGCNELWIGLEAISPNVLKRMNKTDNPESYAEIAGRMMEICSDLGIGLHFCLIFGFPTERSEDLDMLVNFFNNHSATLDRVPFFATINHFSVTPGSHIHEKPTEFDIKGFVEGDDIYDMIGVPHAEEDRACGTFDDVVAKLLSIFVPESKLLDTWFGCAESCHELLLKAHIKNGSPFRGGKLKPTT